MAVADAARAAAEEAVEEERAGVAAFAAALPPPTAAEAAEPLQVALAEAVTSAPPSVVLAAELLEDCEELLQAMGGCREGVGECKERVYVIV